jgi:hypothetical protein
MDIETVIWEDGQHEPTRHIRYGKNWNWASSGSSSCSVDAYFYGDQLFLHCNLRNPPNHGPREGDPFALDATKSIVYRMMLEIIEKYRNEGWEVQSSGTMSAHLKKVEVPKK